MQSPIAGRTNSLSFVVLQKAAFFRHWSWQIVCKSSGQALVVTHLRAGHTLVQKRLLCTYVRGFVWIIDPTLIVCRQIHWDHRSAFAMRQEIHSDPRSKTPYCVGIHRDPISVKRNSRILRVLAKYNLNMHCHLILLIFYPEIA